MNEIFETLVGDDSDTDANLGGYKKIFHSEFNDRDDDSLYIPTVTTLSEKSAILLNADENIVDRVTKNPSPHCISRFSTHGAAPCTSRKWCSSYLWWISWETVKFR